MKTRFFQFDFIRALSALSVVAIHTTSSYVGLKSGFVLNQAVRYAVPMFILISGFLLFHSDKASEGGNYLAFIKKRLHRVLIPYLLWTVLYTLYDYRHSLSSLLTPPSLDEFFRHLLFGMGHLYFVVIILQLYLLYPLLNLGFRKGWHFQLLAASALLTLYFQTASWLLRWDILIFPRPLLGYYYILFPCWIFYFVLGMFLALQMEKWTDSIKTWHIPVAGTWLACLVLLVLESRLNATYESSVKPTVILYTLLSFFLFYSLSHFFQGNALWEKGVRWLSQQSFIIYLSHVLVMKRVRLLAESAGFSGYLPSTAGMVLFFLATTAATFLLAYMASLTPIAPLLGGERQKWKNKSTDVNPPVQI